MLLPTVFLFVTIVWSQQTCFSPMQEPLRGYGVCDPNQAVSLCCAVGDSCLWNGLCMNTSNPRPILYRAGCTTTNYPAHPVGCPGFCPVTKGIGASMIFPNDGMSELQN